MFSIRCILRVTQVCDHVIMNRKSKNIVKKIGSLACVGVVLAGCATQPTTSQEVADPLEGVNRVVFTFNEVVDTWFLRPAATLYRGFVPPPAREGIHNLLSNLSTPIILLNDLLQGEMERAQTTAARFAINTTVGVLGFGDPASEMGYKKHSEDFGQTLAVWGTGEGPYIVLPIFGPSNGRDVIGRVVDYFSDPLNAWAMNTDREGIPITRGVLGAIDARSMYFDEIEDMKKNSLDYYAAQRSFYTQLRNNAINNVSGPTAKPAPALSFEYDSPGYDDEEITEAR